MVRSSMISIGAASEPARSSSAVSLASAVVMRPEIWNRLPSSPRITGAVTTSPLPFSNSRIAMRLPTFSRVTSLHDARALGVERQVHRRLLRLAVEAGLGVGQVLAGQDAPGA